MFQKRLWHKNACGVNDISESNLGAQGIDFLNDGGPGLRAREICLPKHECLFTRVKLAGLLDLVLVVADQDDVDVGRKQLTGNFSTDARRAAEDQGGVRSGGSAGLWGGSHCGRGDVVVRAKTDISRGGMVRGFSGWGGWTGMGSGGVWIGCESMGFADMKQGLYGRSKDGGGRKDVCLAVSLYVGVVFLRVPKGSSTRTRAEKLNWSEYIEICAIGS